MSMIWVCLANVVGTWEIEYYHVFCGFKHQEWGQHSEIISKISTVSGGFNMGCSFREIRRVGKAGWMGQARLKLLRIQPKPWICSG